MEQIQECSTRNPLGASELFIIALLQFNTLLSEASLKSKSHHSLSKSEQMKSAQKLKVSFWLSLRCPTSITTASVPPVRSSTVSISSLLCLRQSCGSGTEETKLCDSHISPSYRDWRILMSPENLWEPSRCCFCGFVLALRSLADSRPSICRPGPGLGDLLPFPSAPCLLQQKPTAEM